MDTGRAGLRRRRNDSNANRIIARLVESIRGGLLKDCSRPRDYLYISTRRNVHHRSRRTDYKRVWSRNWSAFNRDTGAYWRNLFNNALDYWGGDSLRDEEIGEREMSWSASTGQTHRYDLWQAIDALTATQDGLDAIGEEQLSHQLHN